MIAIVVVLLVAVVAIVFALSLIATIKTTVSRATFCKFCAGVSPPDIINNVPQMGGIQRLSPNSSIIFNNPEPEGQECWPKTLSDDYGEHFYSDRAVNTSSSYVAHI